MLRCTNYGVLSAHVNTRFAIQNFQNSLKKPSIRTGIALFCFGPVKLRLQRPVFLHFYDNLYQYPDKIGINQVTHLDTITYKCIDKY